MIRLLSNTKTVLIALLMFVFIGGCEKSFLDLDPPYTQDAENYFNTADDYEQALIGAYDLLQASYLTVWIGEIASDNSIAGGESVTDSKGLHEIDEMNHGGVNSELQSVFRWYYAGIARCNYILEPKDNNLEFDGKASVVAQTKFLRAYYYFELVKFFGDVPLIVDERIGPDDAASIGRTPKNEVYAQIEQDLLDASADLEWMSIEKGRVTKGAALSLLGKVYLYQDKFTEAASTLDQVINSGNYSLIADYNNLFSVANEGHSETVFDVEFSGLEGGSYECLICLEGNATPGFHGIRQYNGPIYGDGNSYNLPTQNLYDAFGGSDLRRTATILAIDAFILTQPNPTSITYAQGGGGHTGLYNNKYIKRIGEIGLPDNDLTSPVNYRVIRYADVLLMAAEAHNRNGNDGTALTYLNDVRTRVSMPNITSGGTALTEDIWLERRFELSGEGHRFFDLVRTGQAAANIEGFNTGQHEVFPLPQLEIDLSGGSLDQNPNY
jgi:hypothetical protein